MGPLKYDVDRVHDAIEGAGTKEAILDELILDLTPEDVGLLKYAYAQKYGKSLLKEIQGDLSGNVRKLFTKALDETRRQTSYADNTATAEKKDLVDPAVDAKALYKGGAARAGTNEDTFYTILTSRRQDHLMQVCQIYLQEHKVHLSQTIKSEFSGHDQCALLHIVRGVEPSKKYSEVNPQALRDAELFEDTMAGLGTKDALLVMRTLRAHWCRPRMDAICAAYLRIHEKTLARRVQGETSGALEDLLVALIRGPPAGS
ncbi:hypothetical protein B0H10DRAFT_722862 [Mycena sp. CBHHK59/15]|nr:hypothetical protein B0H10DRAFT_722862 [Mycena sp. CBHHK59/15]